MYETDMYEGMLAETITMPGNDGELINAYFARPLGSGSVPGDGANSPYARLG